MSSLLEAVLRDYSVPGWLLIGVYLLVLKLWDGLLREPLKQVKGPPSGSDPEPPSRGHYPQDVGCRT